MRNGLVQLTAWVAATSAAVALSWLGVHAVLADAAFEQPRAVPLPSPGGRAADAPPTPQAEPATIGTAASARPADPSSGSPAPTASPEPRSPSPSTGTGTGSRPSADSSVRSCLVPGGRVALGMEPDRAELVSAAPEPGWQMQVWRQEGWLRVDFTQGSKVNSVFVTWNGHPPEVQTVVR
ncbi:hypothetical protein [Saccharothrix sp. ST-888]|uniref:hypothetical protein n=1 Tax=Saccharothrix sp. ST-888 TaxID=1427391 RepID=UPI0005EC532A|nr:hypothetical protein [Saccharothrix sp. ST-888]KJK58139.1 hypothetical protein UK12_12075 [Saccharothrix sp. ST-888]